MSSNPMQRKVRNSFFLGILLMLAVTILIGAVIFFIVIKPKMDAKRKEKQQLYAYVYRLNSEVKSGETIGKSMVEEVEIPVNTNQTDFIIAKDNEGAIKIFPSGYKSKLDLKAGTILTYSMFMEEEKINNSLRYVEYSMISIPTKLEEGDFIDIRLKLPNGQDLIVISKKEIKTLYEQTVGFELSEEEILILDGAIVENYIIEASQLYAATYVEPGMQEAAVYTYTPTAEVIDLIKNDKNIVSTAKQTLSDAYENDGANQIRQQLDTTIVQYNGSAESNIKNGIKEQISSARKARENYLSEME